MPALGEGWAPGRMTMGRATNRLSHRIWFTLGVLVVSRVGVHIPIPGIEGDWLATSIGWYGGWIQFIFPSMLPPPYSVAVFGLGILPYILAAFVLQLMSIVSPHLSGLVQAGEAGRRKLDHYAWTGAVLLSIFLSYRIAVGLETVGGGYWVEPSPWFRLTTVLTMTAGVVILMWLARQIDRRGIGLGAFVIFGAAIAADLSLVWTHMFIDFRMGVRDSALELSLLPLVVLVLVAASVVLACARRPDLPPHAEDGIDGGGSDAEKQGASIPFCVAGLSPVVLAAFLVMPQIGVAFQPRFAWYIPLIQLPGLINFAAAAVLVFALTLLLAPASARATGHAKLAGVLTALVVVLPAVVLQTNIVILPGMSDDFPPIVIFYSHPLWQSSGVALLILTFVSVAVIRQVRDQHEIELWPTLWRQADQSQQER